MAQEPRLFTIAGVSNDERLIVMDQFERITKAQWCELYYHLYQQLCGQDAATHIVDDIRERREIIESHCRAMGPLGKH